MSREQAKYLCDAARGMIDAAIGQGWALAFPSAHATLFVAANYLAAASGELGGDAELAALGGEVAGKGNEILAIGLIPWPFVYAAIGPWANALGQLRSRIPSIVILQPASARSVVPTPPVVPAGFGVPMPSQIQPLPTAAPVVADWTALVKSNSGKGPKGYRRSDERVREDVCEALQIDPAVNATEIEVAVSNGKVSLRGSIQNRYEKRRAEDVALATPGVVDVENGLVVTSSA